MSKRRGFEGDTATIFSRMGMDLDSPGARDTRQGWLMALWDITEGLFGDPKLSTLFPAICPTCPQEEMTYVVEGPISFTGLCEHHVLAIRGSAWVGYLGNEKLIAISKLTQSYPESCALALNALHEPRAPLPRDREPIDQGCPAKRRVYVEAEHFCMRARGMREINSRNGPWSPAGAYTDTSHLGEEFRLLIGRHPALRAQEAESVSLDEPSMHRVHHCFEPIVRSQFFVDAVQVISKGRQRDPQFTRDLGRVLGLGEEPQDTTFLI